MRPLLDASLGPNSFSDSGIAIAEALLLFVLPATTVEGTSLLNWVGAERAPSDILILFGGGLSLAQAIDQTRLAAWIRGALQGLGNMFTVLLAAATACLITFSRS